MAKDKKVISGWILKIFIFLFLVVASARGKFFEWEGKQEMFDKMGFSLDTMFNIGIVEVLVSVLFLLPGRLGFLGGLMLTAYLGGAVATHVRVGDAFFFPIIIGVIAWLGILLSNNEFKNYLLNKKE